MTKMSLKNRLQEILTELQTPEPTPQWSNVSKEYWPVHQVGFAEERLRPIVQELELKEKRRKMTAEARMKLRVAEKKRALAKQYRNSVCSGCYYNRYNFESGGDGWNAPTTGEGCYNLVLIKRGRCPGYHHG